MYLFVRIFRLSHRYVFVMISGSVKMQILNSRWCTVLKFPPKYSLSEGICLYAALLLGPAGVGWSLCRISISEHNLLTHNNTMCFVAGSSDCDNDLVT